LVDFGEGFFINRPPPLGLGIPTRFATPEGVFSKCASPASDVWAIGCLLYEWWSGNKLFEGEDLEEISYDWTQTLGKLPEPYWSHYTQREKYFDDCGKFIAREGRQIVNVDLEYMMKENWDRISTCPGALWDMQTNSIKQICDSISSSFSYNPPKIRLSVIEDQTKRQLIITPEFLCKMTTDPLSPVAPRESHLFEPDSTGIGNAKRLIFHNSNENSEVQLPPLIADLYCLLRQLLTYEPDKRLPALLISQHCWFSNPRLDESCQSAKSNQDIEHFEQPSTLPCTPKLNGPSKSVSDSKITKMSMPSKWSLVLDMENGTWKYVLSSDIKRPYGVNEPNCGS
jgi:serine/threonine protein kinase